MMSASTYLHKQNKNNFIKMLITSSEYTDRVGLIGKLSTQYFRISFINSRWKYKTKIDFTTYMEFGKIARSRREICTYGFAASGYLHVYVQLVFKF